MRDIRRVVLLTDDYYGIGDNLFDGKKYWVIESIYTGYISIEAELLPAYRVYVKDSDSPYMDIPYHAVKAVFYS